MSCKKEIQDRVQVESYQLSTSNFTVVGDVRGTSEGVSVVVVVVAAAAAAVVGVGVWEIAWRQHVSGNGGGDCVVVRVTQFSNQPSTPMEWWGRGGLGDGLNTIKSSTWAVILERIAQGVDNVLLPWWTLAEHMWSLSNNLSCTDQEYWQITVLQTGHCIRRTVYDGHIINFNSNIILCIYSLTGYHEAA